MLRSDASLSALVRELAVQIKAAKLPEPTYELRFDPIRKWRFDLAWPALMLACEVDGGTWQSGRHNRGGGYEKDCQKVNAATLAGWRVLRVTSGMIKSGEALTTIERALGLAPVG